MNIVRHSLRESIVLAVVCLCLSGCLVSSKHYVSDISQYDFQDGDILMQHIPAKLCAVIADVTDSQYSHCGMVVHKNNRLYVLEAIGSVCYTPVKDWINRGSYARFTQLRPINMSQDHIRRAIAEAEKYLGRPYDIQYELDEEKIYCSELIYKAYVKAASIEIGEKETLGSLKWKPQEQFIRYITGGELPLDRVMVTPQSIASNSRVALVYSTFPPRGDDPLFSVSILNGTWEGEYTIKGMEKAIAEFSFDKDGGLKSGTIKLKNGDRVPIVDLQIAPFQRSIQFSAVLKDGRGITARLNVQIRDRGTRIIGTWKDDLGFTGVFSLGKADSL